MDRTAAAALVTAIAAVSTCASCATTLAVRPAAVAPGDLESAQARRAVALYVMCGPGSGRSGSSAMVRGGDHPLVLTASHVVNCAPPTGADPVPRDVQTSAAMIAVDWLGETHAARVVAVDPRRDAAVVELAGEVPGATPAELGPPPGAGAWVCIAAAAPEVGRSCGEVAGEDADLPDAGLVHAAKTVPGNSGAGLYDASGRLVGVVTRSRGSGKVGGRAARADRMRWMVDP